MFVAIFFLSRGLGVLKEELYFIKLQLQLAMASSRWSTYHPAISSLFIPVLFLLSLFHSSGRFALAHVGPPKELHKEHKVAEVHER